MAAAAPAVAPALSSDPILVFGATGVVGSLVIDALLERKTSAKIYAFVRDESKAAAKFGDKVHLIKGDTSSNDDLKKAFAKVGSGARVFVLTYPLPPAGADTEANIAQCAVEHKANQLVKLSTYDNSIADPVDFFVSRLHAEAEAAILSKTQGSATSVTMLRPSSFFQNFVTYDGALIKSQKVFYRQNGDYKYPPVDVRDIADAAAVLLTAADPKKYHLKTYDLTGPQSVSNDDLAATFSEVLETKVTVVYVDDAAYYSSILSFMPDAFATGLVKLGQSYRKGRGQGVQGDYKILTGKESRTFKQFVQDHKAAFTA